MKEHQSHILHSKFFKPKPTSDLVLRTELLNHLSQECEKPLILVSAPSGYGKSTLVSSWLDHQSRTYAWISLNEYDNNWLSFLGCFVHALASTLEGKFVDIAKLLKSPELPATTDLSRFIINKLTELDEDFYLVLDDYHYLHDPAIHEFLNSILEFPIPHFHLIVTSRIDPPFKIHKLRSKDQITEVRSSDLVFKFNDAIKFFDNAIEKSVEVEICRSANEIAEGWITGLRLLSLSFKKKAGKIEGFLKAEHKDLMHELLNEVFWGFSSEVQKFVLKSSVLHQFNPSICDEICGLSEESDASEVLDYLKTSNIFIIPVDSEKGWFRFHHCFRDFLLASFEETYSKEEQEAVHRAAGIWLRNNKYSKDAIIHFIRSGDISKAIAVFEVYRHQIMNEAQWIEYSEIFKLFDERTVNNHLELLLAQAWLNIYAGKPFEMFNLLEPIKALIDVSSTNSKNLNRHIAEFNCLLPYKTYNVDLDFHEAIKQCDIALEYLEEDQRYVRGYAWIFKFGALQAIGKYSEANKLLTSSLEEKPHSIVDSHLYLIQCYLQWIEADFEGLFETSSLLMQHSIQGDKNHEAFANGSHFFGIGKYMINDLESSKVHLEQSYKSRYYTIGVINIMNSITLVLLHLAQNNLSESERIFQEIKLEIKRKRSQLFNIILDVAHAEIYLSKNDADKAIRKVLEVEQIPLTPLSNFYAPQFTLVKVLIYMGDASSLEKATRLTKKYLEFARKTHNKLFEMRFQALQSLQYFCAAEYAAAFISVQEVILKAKVYNLVRVFLDCGPKMKELLIRYNECITSDSYVHELIQAFPLNPNEIELSSREKDVLPLLKLSNKEIAEQLYIAEKTVKRHSNSIFKKLNVKNRREALQKATELKLV